MKIFLLFSFLSFIDSLKINKFCVNCKHIIQDKQYNNEYAKCSLFPMNNGLFLVTGKVSNDNYYYCSTARISENMCGQNATKYTKKYTKKIE